MSTEVRRDYWPGGSMEKVVSPKWAAAIKGTSRQVAGQLRKLEKGDHLFQVLTGTVGVPLSGTMLMHANGLFVTSFVPPKVSLERSVFLILVTNRS